MVKTNAFYQRDESDECLAGACLPRIFERADVEARSLRLKRAWPRPTLRRDATSLLHAAGRREPRNAQVVVSSGARRA